jgi:hypothetical protein
VVLFATGGSGDQPDCEQPEIEMSGTQEADLEGWVHSNGDVSIGDIGMVDGRVTAVGDVDIAPGVVLDPATGNPGQAGGPLTHEPVAIADYRPGGAVAALAAAEGEYYDFSGGDLDEAALDAAGLGHLPKGIYYTDGDIDLPDGGVFEGAFVAEGRIHLSSVTLYWPGDPNRVLALSGHDGGCDEAGVRLWNFMHSFRGRLLAPHSGVEIISPLDECAFISASTEIVATWIRVVGREVFIGALPPPDEEKFLTVGCAVDWD